MITSLVGKSVDGIIFSLLKLEKALKLLSKNNFPVVSMRNSGDSFDVNFVCLDFYKTVFTNV